MALSICLASALAMGACGTSAPGASGPVQFGQPQGDASGDGSVGANDAAADSAAADDAADAAADVASDAAVVDAAIDSADDVVTIDAAVDTGPAPAKPCSYDAAVGVTGKECPDDFVCIATVGSCTGVVNGSCKPPVSACPTIDAPVCGCDGKTYPSACDAQKALAIIKSDGKCQATAATCGGGGGVCPLGQLCDPSTCDAGAPGLCVPDAGGGACPNGGPQECGCDGKSYPNTCYRLAAGVAKKSQGPCPPAPDAVPCKIGPVGKPIGTCPDGQFCRLLEGNPLACTGDGECMPLPPVCDKSAAPVCGCNFQSYANACEAEKSGMNVKGGGSCDGSCNVGSKECGDKQYCAAQQGQCSGKGTCIALPAPTTCNGAIDPVCGCNGKTYTNPACAAVDGVVLKSKGTCGG